MTPLERVRSLPGLVAQGNDRRIEVFADGMVLIWRLEIRPRGNMWALFDEASTPPKQPYHLTLRRLIHEVLNDAD